MKKGFALLIVLMLIILFSTLALFIYEIKSLRYQNNTKAVLYAQAKIHLSFLESLCKELSEDTKRLSLEKDNFLFEIETTPTSYELFVSSTVEAIRLHKRVIK